MNVFYWFDKKTGYVKLIEFFRNNGFKVDLVDFRKSKTNDPEEFFVEGIFADGDPLGYTNVDLGIHSMLKEICPKYEKFRVSPFGIRDVQNNHNRLKNEYCVANSIIWADVIINIPKPKPRPEQVLVRH